MVQHGIHRALAWSAQGTLPDDQNTPPQITKRGDVPVIARSIGVNFGKPEVLSGGWHFEQVAVVAMPKATMGKDDCVVFRENEIG